MQDTTSLSYRTKNADTGQIDRQPRATPDEAIGRLKWIAEWMDSAFRIPGTNRRIGLDSLIGFIPGVGDAITGLVSAEFVRQAIVHGARKRTIFKMAVNILIDTLVGSVPFLGDIFDFAFKANSKNVRLFEEEFTLPDVQSRSSGQ